ncbi:MAG: Crp/Fnr family transcriptional regulator [Acidimicrobiia bacterium]|nr:Crp/Fnr family transcriptional regulator [Acidimicrobiia bacterium]
MVLWDAVSQLGTTVEFAPGSPLVHHGDNGSHCYAILEGEVLVTTTTRQGTRVVLGRRGPGTIIGELSALDPGGRSATVEARNAVRAVVLTARELEQLLRDDPDLALHELRRLAREVRSLTERYTVRGDELRGRVAQLLSTHAGETGEPRLRSTRQELADWVGATREAVIRTLKELERSGVIRLSRGAVEIVEPESLRRLG